VVKVGVIERDLLRLRAGQHATLLLESIPQSEVQAVISSIASSPDPIDGQYLVQLNPSDRQRGLLHPGALVVVRFEDEQSSALQVPLDALVRRQDQDWIFIVEGTSGQQAAHLRAISAGPITGRSVSILSGLRPGERIISEGAAFLKDGQPVHPLD
jgi:RND family efflux transporter MFP subunit